MSLPASLGWSLEVGKHLLWAKELLVFISSRKYQQLQLCCLLTLSVLTCFQASDSIGGEIPWQCPCVHIDTGS